MEPIGGDWSFSLCSGARQCQAHETDMHFSRPDPGVLHIASVVCTLPLDSPFGQSVSSSTITIYAHAVGEV